MKDLLTYVSIVIHLVIVFLLWRTIYRSIASKRYKLNLSIWATGAISMLYFILMGNGMKGWNDNHILDDIFIKPCFFISLYMMWVLFLNLFYSIILLIGKWMNIPEAK